MSYTPEQFEKLPKWAQNEIKRLDNYTKSLEQRINEESGVSETNTFIQDLLQEFPLRKNAKIKFKTGLNGLNQVNVYVRPDGMIDINCDSRLGHDVVILPRASNSFYLHFINRS